MAIVKTPPDPNFEFFMFNDPTIIKTPVFNFNTQLGTLGHKPINMNLNWEEPHAQTIAELLKTPKQVEKRKENHEVHVSDKYKYKPLNKYVGIEGYLPVRAGTTFVGVEVELEQVKQRTEIGGTWQRIDDNSLKDNGGEFVTIPLQFKYLEVELRRLLSGLSSYKTSKRCSVHVHINTRDFSLDELKTFIVLYMIFEKSLYNFSGNRWNNNFCVPLYSHADTVKKFLTLLDGGEIYEKWYKYFGFNLSPIFGGESHKIGTIEFRHMAGTMEIPYIIDWINLIVSLKLMAKKIKYSELEDMIIDMNTTSSYVVLAETVFKDFARLITRQETFKQDVEMCISKLKYVILEDIPCKDEIKVTNWKGV